MQGPYDDQVAFHQDAGKLAESLLAEGFRIMKIWPFDPFAEKTQGMWISDEDIQKGLKPFRQVREAVGNRMEVMCELHSLWSLPAAIRICQALEACDVFWASSWGPCGQPPEPRSAAARPCPGQLPSGRCFPPEFSTTP